MGERVQALGSRRGGLLTLILVAAALVAAATLLIFQFAERPSVSAMGPQPGAALDAPRATVSFAVDGEDRLSDLSVTLDGRDVTGRVRVAGAMVEVPVAGLDDGTHQVAVRFSTDNLFARTVTADWDFEVDTVAPPLTVSAPVPNTTSSQAQVRFRGTSEPGAAVTVASTGGDVSTTAGPRGGWTLVASLPEGVSATAVTAADRAGNTTERRRRHRVDTAPPTLRVSAPAGDEPLTETDQPLIYGAVVGDNPRALTYVVRVNGSVVARADGRSAATAEESLDDGAFTETVVSDAGDGEGSPLTLDGRSFTFAVGTLPQGRNVVTVIA
ncbi:MAG: Ig-like domain-containing protein, partial [Miltoncostaeaceae bacterium]